VQFWNSAAQKLFNLHATTVIGLELAQLPIQQSLQQSLMRRVRAVTEQKKASILRGQELRTGRVTTNIDVHFTPLSRDGSSLSVLLMFSPVAGNPGKSESSRSNPARRNPARKKGNKKRKR